MKKQREIEIMFNTIIRGRVIKADGDNEHFGGTPFGRRLKKIDKKAKRKRWLLKFMIFSTLFNLVFTIILLIIDSLC